MKKILIAALALPLSTAAFAQSTQTGGGAGAAAPRQPGPAQVTTPGTPPSNVVQPGGVENGGPGSVGTEARGATGAESRSNNSGASGNAQKPELAVPNTGGGGGR